MAQKKYTIEQIDEILKENDFHSCICNNEKDGDVCFGVDTIQVALQEDCDYFGEFVGSPIDNEYTFKFYTK